MSIEQLADEPQLSRRGGFSLGGRVAAGFLVLVVLVSIFAPLLAPYDPAATGVGIPLSGPTVDHPFGTDELGRDLLSRVMFGGRLALGIPAAGTLLALVLGVVIGLTAAYGRGWVDNVLMRSVDVVIALPGLLLALVLVAAMGSSVWSLVVVLGLLMTSGAARVYRASVLEELQAEYQLAAVAEGMSPLRIGLAEILPNTVPTILSMAMLSMSAAMLTEASLSFLGLGVAPPAASWGTLLQLGYRQLYSSATYVMIPGMLIVATVVALNVVGSQIQTALDPRTGSSRGS